jgi:hypothetical protein
MIEKPRKRPRRALRMQTQACIRDMQDNFAVKMFGTAVGHIPLVSTCIALFNMRCRRAASHQTRNTHLKTVV